MHDCRKTKEDLIDLVFNEMSAEEELCLLEELEACRACNVEYQSMQQALNNFDEAAPLMLPAVEFWPEHHARLKERLRLMADTGREYAPPFWRRVFNHSFTVPVPAAIAAALLLAATSVLAIRSLLFTQGMKTAPGEAASVKIQYVEVPVEKRVIEEKIVTRTVYVTKRAGRNSQPAPSLQNLQDMTAQTSKDQTAAQPRATLKGFQPPADVKLTVIKGRFSDEK